MSYYNDPQKPGAKPATPGQPAVHQTDVHVDRPVHRERSSSTSLAFIVGGVVVAVIVLYLIFGGMFGNNRTGVTGQSPVGSSNTINVAPAPATQGGTAPTQTAPAPGAATDVAPAQPVVPAPAD